MIYSFNMESINIIEKFKKHNIRVTPQRLEVYNILNKESRHMSAEDIYKEVAKVFPSISLATVYSILSVLSKEKLINELRIDFDKSYFDIRVNEHHHFLCRRCGRVIDVDIPPCSILKEKRVGNNLIEDFQGYFYGVCGECGKKLVG